MSAVTLGAGYYRAVSWANITMYNQNTSAMQVFRHDATSHVLYHDAARCAAEAMIYGMAAAYMHAYMHVLVTVTCAGVQG